MIDSFLIGMVHRFWKVLHEIDTSLLYPCTRHGGSRVFLKMAMVEIHYEFSIGVFSLDEGEQSGAGWRSSSLHGKKSPLCRFISGSFTSDLNGCTVLLSRSRLSLPYLCYLSK